VIQVPLFNAHLHFTVAEWTDELMTGVTAAHGRTWAGNYYNLLNIDVNSNIHA
jgi:hypothetical protein